MANCYENMFTWLKANQGKIFRFLIYRRMFTPYEIDEKYSDETVYEDGGNYEYGKIEEVIQLDGDYLVGIKLCYVDYDPCEISERGAITYVRLSEIRLSCFDIDNEVANGTV